MANMERNIPKELSELQSEDFIWAAQYIWEEWARRKSARVELESAWDEIDRQVKMKYDPPRVDQESGRARRATAWLPTLELPWQRETLEILVSDADRAAFPGVGNHFEAEGDANESVLEAIEREIQTTEGAIGAANTELVNEIITAVHDVYQRTYGYRGQWRRMFADCFKYGTMVGRQRPSQTKASWWDGEGHRRNLTIPLLSRMPIRNCYLDATHYAAQRQGWVQAPSQIYEYTQRLADLQLAAEKFPADPTKLEGGWLPDMLVGLTPRDDNGNVDVLEYEGDFIFERGGGEYVFIPQCIITTIQGQAPSRVAGGEQRVIRIRYPDMPFPSYLYQPYFVDSSEWEAGEVGKPWNGGASQLDIYGTSPLMMGRPIQKAASVTLNRWLGVIILNAEPPLGYDPTDVYMAAAGGPIIEPRALWPTTSGVTPAEIGDPAVLGAALLQLRAEYQDVTGTSAPRLGQQTKSHQTAFAIDTELIRGLSRTVSFVQWVTSELMPRQLQMEYYQIRKYLPKDGLRVMLPQTKAWITVKGSMLPDYVRYTVAGAADPLIEREKQQRKLQALQLVAATEQASTQLAGNPPINWRQLQREILTEGGFTDVDRILEQQQQPPRALFPPAAGGVAGLGGAAAPISPVPGAGQGVPTAPNLRLAAGQGAPVE